MLIAFARRGVPVVRRLVPALNRLLDASRDKRALVLEYQFLLMFEDVDLTGEAVVLMSDRVVEELANHLGRVAPRLGGEQRRVFVEESVLLVAYLAQDLVDLQDERRLEVLIGDGVPSRRV